MLPDLSPSGATHAAPAARAAEIARDRQARAHVLAQRLILALVVGESIALVANAIAGARPLVPAVLVTTVGTAIAAAMALRGGLSTWERHVSALAPIAVGAFLAPGVAPIALALLAISYHADVLVLGTGAITGIAALAVGGGATRGDGVWLAVEIAVLLAWCSATRRDGVLIALSDAAREMERADATRQEGAELENELSNLVAAGERREMERSVEARGRFLAAMGHELRTPLNAVVGYLELLSVAELAPTQATHVVGARMASRHVLELVDDVLDHAKIESGRLQLDSVPFSLRELVTSAVDLMSRAATDKGLALSVRVADDAPDWVVGDPLRVRQILLNLLSNAVKFTATGGVRVCIERRHEDATTLVSVADDGPGVHADLQQRIFEPYRQANESTAREHGGTGLGLAISRELARAMNGDLTVESAKGCGATFKFRAPLEASARPKSQPLAPRVRARGLVVLFADDNAVNRLVGKQLLEVLGHKVELAEDGEQAVVAALARKHDVVIMDVEMPNVDGLVATSRLRAGGYQVPIIAFTAHAGGESVERCRRAGMTLVMQKPIDLDRLTAALQQVVPTSASEPVRPIPEPAPTSASDASSVDLGGLRDRLGGDDALVRSVLDAMTAELPRLSTDVRDTFERRDAPALGKALHALKGCAANACSKALVQELVSLEQDATAGGLPSASVLQRALANVDTLERALREGAGALTSQ